MKAKDKAQELVERMQAQRYMSLGASAQCALICVDEIIKTIQPHLSTAWWQEVKEEIMKL